MLHTSAFNDMLYTLQMQHILYDLQATSIPVFSKHFRKFLSTFDLISVQNIFEQLKLFAKSCLGALVNAIHLHGSDTVGHGLRFLTLFLGCKTTDWPAICGSQSHEQNLPFARESATSLLAPGHAGFVRGKLSDIVQPRKLWGAAVKPRDSAAQRWAAFCAND